MPYTPARRSLLKLLAAAPAASALGGLASATPATAATGPGIVKPLPPELFTIRGTNAESRYDSFKGTGFLTPTDRFFVRNHTSTPVLDAADWRLTLWATDCTAAAPSTSATDSCATSPPSPGRPWSSAPETAAASTPPSRARPSAAPPGPSARSARPAGAGPASPTCCGAPGSRRTPWTYSPGASTTSTSPGA